MSDTIFYPRYNQSVLSLSNAVLNHYGAPTSAAPLVAARRVLKKTPKNVVLWILDGMGSDLMARLLSPHSFLRRHVVREISSVFPPTTTAATTTYYSGLPPVTHGWAGWAPFFAEENRYVALFTGKDDYTGEDTSVRAWESMSYTHLFDQIRPVAPDVTCTHETAAKIDSSGARTFDEQGRRILKHLRRPGRQFVLAYWPDPDHTCHHCGTYSDETRQVLRHMNTVVRRVCARARDTVFLISADHGHVPVRDIFWVDECPALSSCLARPIGLDDRVSSIFLSPGKEEHFKEAFRQYLADDFILINSDEALARGLFGTGPIHPRFRSFLGDWLIVAIGETVLRQRVGAYLSGPVFKSAHAGLTRREMVVPLIVANCR